MHRSPGVGCGRPRVLAGCLGFLGLLGVKPGDRLRHDPHDGRATAGGQDRRQLLIDVRRRLRNLVSTRGVSAFLDHNPIATGPRPRGNR